MLLNIDTEYERYLNTEGITPADIQRYKELNIEKSIQFSEVYYHEVQTICKTLKDILKNGLTERRENTTPH